MERFPESAAAPESHGATIFMVSALPATPALPTSAPIYDRAHVAHAGEEDDSADEDAHADDIDAAADVHVAQLHRGRATATADDTGAHDGTMHAIP